MGRRLRLGPMSHGVSAQSSSSLGGNRCSCASHLRLLCPLPHLNPLPDPLSPLYPIIFYWALGSRFTSPVKHPLSSPALLAPVLSLRWDEGQPSIFMEAHMVAAPSHLNLYSQ